MINAAQTFSHKTQLFPGIGTGGTQRVQIPVALKSALNPKVNSMHQVPWAALDAACLVLVGRVALHVDDRGEGMTVRGTSAKGSRLSRIERAAGQMTWFNTGSAVRAFVHTLAESAVYGLHDELRERWAQLITVIKGHASLPLSPTALSQLSSDTDVKAAMFAVVDSLYFTATQTAPSDVSVDVPDVPEFQHTPLLFGESVVSRNAAGEVLCGTERRLMRRMAAGLRTLLAGPTGTGKTELAKRVALRSGMKLVVMKGRPGLEDRDMIGGIYPTERGPRWVDGPLARAFRMAQDGQRVAVIQDEVMRLDPYHRNTYVGLMDELSEVEVQAITGKCVTPGRYYVLELNGAVDERGQAQVLCARTDHLSFIHTTNLGAAYTQSGELDPALKRRFQLVEFVQYPAKDVVMPLYERACGSCAEVAYQLEVETRGMTVEAGQTLSQPMNIGVTLNYLTEVQSLLDDGVSRVVALREALGSTVAPFCAELGEDGLPDGAAVKSLQVTLERVLQGR